MTTNNPIDTILQKTNNRQTGPNQWEASCPCRQDDDNPSLRISTGNQNQVLLKCQRGDGCDLNKICDALNITPKDLYPANTKQQLTHTDTYRYTDENGTVIFEVLRYLDQNGKKTFKQRQPNPDGTWEWNTKNITEKPLYRLPQIIKAKTNGQPIYIVEGEKDVHTLEKLGKTATTNAGGAGSWQQNHTQTLAGANIIIIADNDQPGRVHARQIANELTQHGSKIKTYTTKTHKDITDAINNGETLQTALTPLDTPLETLIQTLTNIPPNSETTTQQTNNAINTYNQQTNQTQNTPNTPNKPLQNQPTITTWQTFIQTHQQTPHDWIIPHLLETQERVIIVAPEGAGKSTLSRQIALMTAAGIHPFRQTPIKPQTTLTIDLENPPRIIHRTTQKLWNNTQKHANTEQINAHLYIKPDGLNLLNPHDQQHLENIIQQTQPRLTIIGPIYKTYTDPGNRTAEAITTELAKYLDHIRTTYNTALWLEHHAPLATGGQRDLRPFGSSVWSRWSEYGLALTPDPTDPNTIQLKHYRGQREPRDWPETLTRGTTWPFQATTYTQYTP